MDNWLNAKNKPNQTQFKANCRNRRNSLPEQGVRKNNRPGAGKNQTQFKPIAQRPRKMNVNQCNIKNYDIFSRSQPKKAKPIQTRFEFMGINSWQKTELPI
jgi:hypothetical protein